mmetsp:Transcript_30324/g.50384  ORF Transcript_30324/g.50384 Transcript_30324/m.50384 type:complete len:222 (+) Transcript_30324:611-1276(+)
MATHIAVGRGGAAIHRHHLRGDGRRRWIGRWFHGFAPHFGFLTTIVILHFGLVSFRVFRCQLGILGETIRVNILPALSNDFPHFLKRNLSSILLEPSQRFFVEVIVGFGIFLKFGRVVGENNLENLLSFFFKEKVVRAERTLGLVLGLFLGGSLHYVRLLLWFVIPIVFKLGSDHDEDVLVVVVVVVVVNVDAVGVCRGSEILPRRRLIDFKSCDVEYSIR